MLVEEEEGVIYFNRILPIDTAYQDSPETLPGGKPKPPHDYDQETLENETPLQQRLLDGSSRRSHQHWKQVYQYYKRHEPTPAELNGRDVILKQHNVLEVLKSAGALPKGEGPIVQVLDSIRRWEEQFLQVLRGFKSCMLSVWKTSLRWCTFYPDSIEQEEICYRADRDQV